MQMLEELTSKQVSKECELKIKGQSTKDRTMKDDLSSSRQINFKVVYLNLSIIF